MSLHFGFGSCGPFFLVGDATNQDKSHTVVHCEVQKVFPARNASACRHTIICCWFGTFADKRKPHVNHTQFGANGHQKSAQRNTQGIVGACWWGDAAAAFFPPPFLPLVVVGAAPPSFGVLCAPSAAGAALVVSATGTMLGFTLNERVAILPRTGSEPQIRMLPSK